jgi:Fanconi anemia group M protein
VRGFILSIILNYQIPIVFTKDFQDSASYLLTLAKQQAKPRQEVSLHSRIPKTKNERKRYILEAFPGVGPSSSRKLIKKFGSLKKIINADEKELEDILGKKTSEFRKLVGG